MGASCCAKLLQFLYIPAIATEMYFIYYLSPQHASAPTGGTEHQSSFCDAINTTTDPLFCDCLYIWSKLIYIYFTVFFIML
jgi:hypothetical protein